MMDAEPTPPPLHPTPWYSLWRYWIRVLSRRGWLVWIVEALLIGFSILVLSTVVDFDSQPSAWASVESQDSEALRIAQETLPYALPLEISVSSQDIHSLQFAERMVALASAIESRSVIHLYGSLPLLLRQPDQATIDLDRAAAQTVSFLAASHASQLDSRSLAEKLDLLKQDAHALRLAESLGLIDQADNPKHYTLTFWIEPGLELSAIHSLDSLPIVKRIEGFLEPGESLMFAGEAIQQHHQARLMRLALFVGPILVMLFGAFFGRIVFRSWRIALLTAFVTGLQNLVLFALTGWTASFSVVALPVLLLGTILPLLASWKLIADYTSHRAWGQSHADALVLAMDRNGSGFVLISVMVVVALLPLLILPQAVFQDAVVAAVWAAFTGLLSAGISIPALMIAWLRHNPPESRFHRFEKEMHTPSRSRARLRVVFAVVSVVALSVLAVVWHPFQHPVSATEQSSKVLKPERLSDKGFAWVLLTYPGSGWDNESTMADHAAQFQDALGERSPDILAVKSEIVWMRGLLHVLDENPAAELSGAAALVLRGRLSQLTLGSWPYRSQEPGTQVAYHLTLSETLHYDPSQLRLIITDVLSDVYGQVVHPPTMTLVSQPAARQLGTEDSLRELPISLVTALLLLAALCFLKMPRILIVLPAAVAAAATTLALFGVAEPLGWPLSPTSMVMMHAVLLVGWLIVIQMGVGQDTRRRGWQVASITVTILIGWAGLLSTTMVSLAQATALSALAVLVLVVLKVSVIRTSWIFGPRSES